MWNHIILGISQGIFEWLPISSEGIVALFSQTLIKNVNPVDMALFLHLGTLLAVLFYFRKDWKEIILLRNKRMIRFLIIATVISLVVSYPLYRLVRSLVIGNMLLIITGIGLLFTAYFHKNKGYALSFDRLAVLSGFIQGLSVIPGLSRSGSTIFGLSFSDFNPAKVLKVSYIMSVPVIIVSSVYLLLFEPVVYNGWVSLIPAFIVGIISLKFLMDMSKKINFFWFSLIFAILCFIGAIIGLIYA